MHMTCKQRGHNSGGGKDSHRGQQRGVTEQWAQIKTRLEALNLDTFLCLRAQEAKPAGDGLKG